jgi:transcriptional regulator with XRE-family HTH domain
MTNVIFDARFHARISETSTGHKSGRSSDRETPVSRSIGKTNSAGTPRLERVSQYQTCDCVVPMRSASGFCPPAASHARFSASVVDMTARYPDLGRNQPKNLWATTKLKFGSVYSMDRQEIDPKEFGRRVRERRVELGMSQPGLAEKSGQSQSNISWIEKGNAKKPKQQALDLVEPLRTSVDWLLYGSGPKETGLRPLSEEEMLEIYRGLALEQREQVSETFSKLAKDNKKRRKTA